MPSRSNFLKHRLLRHREIRITVTGRKFGRAVSTPVWFVLEHKKLYLLPVQGSCTQCYKNVLADPVMRIDARGAEEEFRAVPITEPDALKSVVDKFRDKYGTKDVKKYYSKFE
jgi:hypothetical protein